LPGTLNSESKLQPKTEVLELKKGMNAVDFRVSKHSMISSLGKDHPMIALYAGESAPNNLILSATNINARDIDNNAQ